MADIGGGRYGCAGLGHQPVKELSMTPALSGWAGVRSEGRGVDLFTSPARNVSACKCRCAGENCGSLFSLLQLSFCFEPVSTSHLAGKEIHYGPRVPHSLLQGDAGVLALAL